MSLPDGISQHFVGDTKGYTKMLENLWAQLDTKEYFAAATGPYPVTHGRKHVETVLMRVADLITSFSLMEKSYKFEIFAAGMIHDLGMIKMLPVGADSKKADECREKHANHELIDSIAGKTLEQLEDNNSRKLPTETKKRITLIASGHAGDNQKTARQKQEEAKKDRIHSDHLVKGMKILRLADYLDLGEDRLLPEWHKHDWSDNQLRHLKQHRVLNIETKDKQIVVNKRLSDDFFSLCYADDKEKKILVPPGEVIAILRTVHEKLRPILDDYNQVADDNKKWHLEPLDEKLFGIVWPVFSGLGLFQDILKGQLNMPRTQGSLQIDLMGHSLSGRFKHNEENLNEKLMEHLHDGLIKMRVLLLDPHIENQQMCEVFDAQRECEPEGGRSILPGYDKDGHVTERGDILESLEVLRNVWREKVGARSSLEVRLTSRLMYMNLSRYGDVILATPYSGRGLFNSSMGLLHGKESVVNEMYEKEFESIWESQWETRLYLHVDKNDKVENPVKRLIPSSPLDSQSLHPLDYERYFLKNYTDRIIDVFKYVKNNIKTAPPPIEVEIQPSSECNLRCWHCIGKNLPHRHEDRNILPLGRADALFEWKSGKYKIERFRISGLLGDPLHKKSAGFTFDFLSKAKKKGRHSILFTNCLGMNKSNYNKLLLADDIHISLDAAESSTFEKMKGAQKEDFTRIKKNVTSLCANLQDGKHPNKRIGIGFVVNETNFSEVEKAIEWAKNVGASFIRFKPDIRSTKTIHWRTWHQAKSAISKAQEKNNGELNIIMTDVMREHLRLPSSDRCWAQYFFASIAPTGKIHVCDHLTESNGETSIGDLSPESDLNTLWKNALKDNKIGRKTSHCQLCPPFNWHINWLLEQLYVLYDQYDKKQLKAWIDEV